MGEYKDINYYATEAASHAELTPAVMKQQIELLRKENLRLSAENVKLRRKEVVELNIYDQEEIHHNCTVQILSSSVTGAVSIGWYPEGTFTDDDD